jgi:hypothetical protein
MAANDFTGFGLAVGSVFGQRSWVIDRLGRLTSVVHDGTPWRPGVNEAKCDTLIANLDRILSRSRASALVPDEADENHLATCVCGFYAYFDKQHNNYADSLKGISVEGVIEGFGKTVLGDKGFRAEKARIVALTLPKPKKDKTPWLVKKMYDLDQESERDLIMGFWVLSAVTAVVSVVTGLLLALVARSSWASPVLALSVWSAYAILCVMQADRYSPPRSPNREKLFALVRRNYPDVKFYDTATEMYAAHPLTPPPEETLDPTTDEFWTRKV